MGNGNDSILEAYLFETNSLLEQLDSLVLAAEEKDSFSEEDVNTIFRIMHTIKGSSAMMEYSSLMTIAHRAEDLFAIVRDKSMEIVPEALRPALFDLLFQIIDFFRGEIEHIENGQPLTQTIDSLLQKVNSFIQQFKMAPPLRRPRFRRPRRRRRPRRIPVRQPSPASPMLSRSSLTRVPAWRTCGHLCL